MTDLPDGFRPNDPTARSRTDHGYSEAEFECSEHPPGPGEADSTPWIMIAVDLAKLGIRGSEGGFLGLEFREGVTLREGEQLAAELRRLLVGVSLAQFRS